MTPIESVVHSDFTDHIVNSLESPIPIIKLNDIESYGGIHNYIDFVKYNSEALGLLNEHLEYKVSEVSNSSQRKNLHILQSMILNSLTKKIQ